MAEWEWTQKDPIHERKDRSRRSDAKREDQQYSKRESRRFTELTACISKIPANLFQPEERALVAMQLFCLLYSAVCAPGRNACFLRGHTLLLEVILKQRKMRSDFSLQLFFDLSIPEKAEKLGKEPPKMSHY
jgi:hypothetical protein